MKVINLFAGPGAGKSTLAAALFASMKRRGVNVDLVTEYAKDMVWESRTNILDDQLYILAKQNRRLHRLRGQVDIVITDSPLLLSLVYARPDYFQTYEDLLREVWDSYDNHCIFVERVPGTFSAVGRVQADEAEAVEFDHKVMDILDQCEQEYEHIEADVDVERYVTSLLNHFADSEEQVDLARS